MGTDVLSASSNQLGSISTDMSVGITKRMPVTSSQISAIGYDIDDHILEIEFLTGEVWQYQSSPPDIYHRFAEATSKGKYYLQEIKGKYVSKRLQG